MYVHIISFLIFLKFWLFLHFHNSFIFTYDLFHKDHLFICLFISYTIYFSHVFFKTQVIYFHVIFSHDFMLIFGLL